MQPAQSTSGPRIRVVVTWNPIQLPDSLLYERQPHPAVSTDALDVRSRSEEHTSELQSRLHLVCRLLLEKKKQHKYRVHTCPTCILSALCHALLCRLHR